MSSDLETSFREKTKTENVFLFVPNIIGLVDLQVVCTIILKGL